MGRGRLIVALLLATLVAPLAVPSVARSQTESREEALERIRGEIARLQVRLGRMQQEQQSLENQLSQTSLELELQERRVEESRAAQELALANVAALEQRVAELEEALEQVREDLRGRLVTLYRLGRAGYLRLLLAIERDGAGLQAVRQVRFMARRDGEARDRFVDARVRLELEEEELETERRRVEAWVAQEEERRVRLAALRRQQATLLARLERERREIESRSDALADEERRLANFIAFLYGRNSTPLSGTPLQEFRGVLDWPVAGEVTVGFGLRRDDRYGTQVPHNGIELAPTPGDPVKVVFPGKVLFAAPFKGYGQTVVVHHPGRVFTLYAGLQALGVAYGDVVTLGQVVGRASDRLYFEIRIENRPEDPRTWLRD